MSFGPNILPQAPADWSLSNASMALEAMRIHAGGYVKTSIDYTQSNGVKQEYKVSLIASSYPTPYKPFAFFEMHVVYDDGTEYRHSVPIVDTGNGICSATIPCDVGQYKTFDIVIKSFEELEITYWSLAYLEEGYGELLDTVRQELPRLLYYYNTSVFDVAQEETTIGFITAELLENADLNGHLQVSYIAANSCTIVLRIYDNEVQELYTPLVYDVLAGRGSLGIPHAYLKRLVGIHSFLVTAQVSEGSASIITRGLMYTIDGGYLAKRLMSISADVRDITLRQLPNTREPDYVYVVAIDDGMARVRRKKLSSSADAAFEPVFEVGPATNAAVEFNGSWRRLTGDKLHTLETGEEPFVAWVDTANDLWVQQGTDESTRVRLANGVSDISMCRCFQSIDDIQQDHGLVIAYIKNGVVCYRSWVPSVDGAMYIWSLETALEQMGTTNTHIQVTRLLDYRVCFATTSASGCDIYITDRNWVGQAMDSDFISYIDTYDGVFIKTDIQRHYTQLAADNVATEDTFISMYVGNDWEKDVVPNITSYTVSSDGRTLTCTFEVPLCNMNAVPIEKMVCLENTILASHVAEDNVTWTLQLIDPVNTKRTLDIRFKNCYMAGYLGIHGIQLWNDTVLKLALVPPRDEIVEHLNILDIEGDLLVRDIVRSYYGFDEHSDHVSIVDTYEGLITMTPLSDKPI